MYETFYNLSAMPFQLTPDSRFFFGSKGHSKAIAHLNYGLAQGEGFIIVTGEVGAGKTTLVEWLRSQMDPAAYTIARVSTTQVSENDLFRLAMAGFGLTEEGLPKSALLQRFEGVLSDHQAMGRRCLLIVDEAQNLSFAALEELRMLSNITVDGRTALQTILLGQPQFRRLLASPNLDQLRQRVLTSYHLGPITQEETRAYIEHRLYAVGWAGDPHWDDDAFTAVFAHTGGIPRRINRLCSRVLLYGVLEETHDITGAVVDATAVELSSDLEGVRGDWTDLPPAPGAESAGYTPTPDLVHRIEALETQMAQREQVFRRLTQMLGVRG
ncbi:MAG: AAA family ATPase [Gemmatimonadaceae bacterium]|nr:AAA family ATPase [Acetobacteraceae bacterium]